MHLYIIFQDNYKIFQDIFHFFLIIQEWKISHEFPRLSRTCGNPDMLSSDEGIALFFFSLFGSQRRWSLSLPILTLIFPDLLPCLVRDSLCTALQTKILWINWSLNAIDTIETWVSGNLTALTERSQPAIRWTRGRGGESCVWQLFPWRTLISTYSEP